MASDTRESGVEKEVDQEIGDVDEDAQAASVPMTPLAASMRQPPEQDPVASSSPASSSRARPRDPQAEAVARKQRWRSVMQQGVKSFMAQHPDRFRRRAKRGIPTEYRWEVWKAAVGVDERIRTGLYQELVQKQNRWTRLVEIDIPRTFPDMPLFDHEQQQSLLRILNAYANLNEDVGYCQGMNFVVGLLMYVCLNEDFAETPRLEKEEECFWMFVCLMEDRRLSGFYKGRFPLLRRYLWAYDQIAVEALPELRAHFGQECIQPGVYLHQWFLTLFINCLPLPMVLVFWDVMICGGPELMLPITVSLLQVVQGTLLGLPFEDILRFFKTMRCCEDPDCDAAAIARCVVEGGGNVLVPDHVNERLSAPIDEDDCEWTPSYRGASPAGLGLDESNPAAQTSGWGFGLVGPLDLYGRLGDISLDRAAGWIEDAKDNFRRQALGQSSIYPNFQ